MMKRFGIGSPWLGIGLTVIAFFIVQDRPAFPDPSSRLQTADAAASDWLSLGQPIKAFSSLYVDVDASRHALNPSLVFSRSVPYLAWSELNSHGMPQVYIRHWNGSAWIKDGPSQNVDTTHRAYDLTMSSNGKIPYLAWIEPNRHEIPQLYVKRLDGDQWILDGGSRNLDPAHGAANPAMAAAEPGPYLAWSEQNSRRVFQLYVGHLSKEGWRMDGEGSLNLDPTQDAIEPAIALQESAPAIAWMESSDRHVYQVHVKGWTGAGWQRLGQSLNIDPTSHAMNPSIALFGGSPHVAWTEIDGNGVSRLFVKHWTNGAWVPDGESLNRDPARHAMSPALMRIGSALYAAWTEYDPKGISQVHVARWTGRRWEPIDPGLETDPSIVSSSPSLADSGAGAHIVWKEINGNGLFHIVVKSLRTK